MLNSTIESFCYLSFLDQQHIEKLIADSKGNALSIFNAEGELIDCNYKATTLLTEFQLTSNLYSENVFPVNFSFEYFNNSSFHTSQIGITLQGKLCILEIEKLTTATDFYLSCIIKEQTDKEVASSAQRLDSNSVLLLPLPVLVLSQNLALVNYNEAANIGFDKTLSTYIGCELDSFLSGIAELISTQHDKDYFKDIQGVFCDKQYLFNFQIIELVDGQIALRFIEIVESHQRSNLLSIEKKHKAIIDANPDLLFILSKDGLILDAIFSSEKPNEYKPDFFLNKNIIEVLPQSVSEKGLKSLEDLFLTGEKQIFKYQFVVDKEVRFFEARLVVFDNDKALSIIRDITEQEQASVELKQERNLMQMLLDYSPVRFFFKDVDSCFVRVNKALVDSFGVQTEDEIIGKSDFDFFTREHAENTFNIEKQIIQSGQPILNTDEKESRLDGRINWALNSRLPLLDMDKNIIGTFGVSLDITERKKAEEALRDSEDRLRLFVEHSSDILVYLDENGIQKYISPSAERITGFTVEELQRSFTEVIHPDDVALVINGFKQLLAEPNQVLKGEYRHKCKDGTYKYMETIGRNYINHPNIRGIVSNVRDITDRKLTEIALNKQNHEYEELNESLKESNSLIVSINNALMDTIDALAKSEQMLKEQNEEYQVLNENLTESNIRIELINSDLHKAKEKAEESDRLKSDFLANMSHEIRTPMNGLIGFSQMLAEPDISDKKRILYAKIIEQSCNQLLAIINDIIDISKVESNQMTVNKTKVDINAVLDKYGAFFEPSGRRKGVSIVVTDYLGADDACIFTDELKLNQILTNLIGNALKFTNSGSIKFGCTVKDEFLKFYVKDTGIGIETENFNVIFDRFRQVETGMARSYGGTGLGLAISKAFVELLGGVIWIESVVNQGSTFYFTLPIELNSETL